MILDTSWWFPVCTEKQFFFYTTFLLRGHLAQPNATLDGHHYWASAKCSQPSQCSRSL